MTLSLLLTLTTVLSPLPYLSEPLTLSTGEELQARHLAPSDEFCLSLQDFATLQGDQIHVRDYWEGRMNRLRADFLAELDKAQASHKAVHKAYLDEQELLKAELAESIKQRDLARSDLWWWRGATIGLTLSTSVTLIYLLGR